MGSTYTYQNLVDHTQALVKGIPVSNISALTADQIHAIMWRAHPWRWTRAKLTAIPLVDGTQDYSIDAADVSTFWKPVLVRITLTSSSPDQYRDLRIFRHLEPSLSQKIGWPNFQLVSYEVEASNKLRLESAVSVPSGITMQIDGEYQKQPTKITSLASTISFPDYYANVYCEGLLWMLYRLAGDKRAGNMVITNSIAQYTGQLGVFFDALISMKEQEEGGYGSAMYPEESIGGSVESLTSGIFGF